MKTDIVVSGYIVYEDKVLLIHHRKLDLWLPVGGHIDPDEVPDDAMIREAKEEVGLDITLIGVPQLPYEFPVRRLLVGQISNGT